MGRKNGKREGAECPSFSIISLPLICLFVLLQEKRATQGCNFEAILCLGSCYQWLYENLKEIREDKKRDIQILYK
jgi:hypothetical protein